MSNELKPDLLSLAALNPFSKHLSSSRATMFTSSHLGQCLVVKDSTKRRIFSGLEREFGKYTFSSKIPCDATILKIIPKYRPVMGQTIPPENPVTTIIYEEYESKRIGMVKVLNNSLSVDSKHQHFGFKYNKTEAFNKLKPNDFVPANTILADSPNIDEDGDYNFGLETNVAYMSVPGIIEDGIVVSESYLERLKTKGFEERTIHFGDGHFPLNLYGDDNEYKPFPNIGEYIKDDGLLFALRSYDDLLAPVEMSKASLGQPDAIFDKLTYTGVSKAKVVDIKIHHNNMAKSFPTPTGMESQVDYYYKQEFNYHKAIIDAYSEFYKNQRDGLELTPEFHREVVVSMGYIGPEYVPVLKDMPEHKRREIYGTRVDKKFRRSDINDWMVTVQFEYDFVPSIGSKLSNTGGGSKLFNICR